MSLKHFIAVAFAAVALVGVAQAREPVTAELVAPVSEAKKIVAASVVWNCEGTQCVAIMRERPNVRSCRLLAREVGALAAYGTETRPLDDAAMVSCNEAARQVAARN